MAEYNKDHSVACVCRYCRADTDPIMYRTEIEKELSAIKKRLAEIEHKIGGPPIPPGWL